MTTEILNLVSQRLNNAPGKMPDEKKNEMPDRNAGFGLLLEQDVKPGSHPHAVSREKAAKEERETEEEAGVKKSVTLVPLHMGFNAEVQGQNIFRQPGQKGGREIAIAQPDISEELQCTAGTEAKAAAALESSAMKPVQKHVSGRAGQPVFFDKVETGREKNIGFRQNLPEQAQADHPADSTAGNEQDISKGRKSKQDVMQMFSAGSTVGVDVDSARAKISQSPEIGDKIQLKTSLAGVPQEGRIQGLEIIQNRKSGDLRLLHLKLMPDNLGTVEARMRMTGNGLHIELQAERDGTARLLAADHQMLVRTLEKSGLQDYGHVSITVVERAAHTVQATGSSGTAHTGGQAFGNGQAGQGTGTDPQAFGHSGQGGRQSSDKSQKDFLFTGQQSDNLGKDDNASHDPRRLVI